MIRFRSDYAQSHSYSAADEATKRAFVEKAVCPSETRDGGRSWRQYRGLQPSGRAPCRTCVCCVDIDPACINTLYRRIREGGPQNVVPIVGDLLNPTPALGWNLAERQDLFSRIRSDPCARAGASPRDRRNVPLSNIVDVLFRIAPGGVVEWVDKSDAMVQLDAAEPDRCVQRLTLGSHSAGNSNAGSRLSKPSIPMTAPGGCVCWSRADAAAPAP